MFHQRHIIFIISVKLDRYNPNYILIENICYIDKYERKTGKLFSKFPGSAFAYSTTQSIISNTVGSSNGAPIAAAAASL